MDWEKLKRYWGKLFNLWIKGFIWETVLQEEGGWVAILSKGSHSDRANLSQDLVDSFLNCPALRSVT